MKLTISKAIGQALHEEMVRDPNVILMGEDVGVMGNVFAISRGFLDEFGANRVIDTPISESGFTGMAVGAELSVQITEELFDELDSPVGRVAGLNVVSPFSPVLEDAEFPHPEDIVSGVKKTLGR